MPLNRRLGRSRGRSEVSEFSFSFLSGTSVSNPEHVNYEVIYLGLQIGVDVYKFWLWKLGQRKLFGRRVAAYRIKAEGLVMVFVREISYYTLLTVIIT